MLSQVQGLSYLSALVGFRSMTMGLFPRQFRTTSALAEERRGFVFFFFSLLLFLSLLAFLFFCTTVRQSLDVCNVCAYSYSYCCYCCC